MVATVGCVSLAHLRRGGGEPLVLIHGVGSRRQIWDPVLDALAGQREVLALDLPGFGASPVPPSGQPTSRSELAEAVCALLDEVGWDRPHVIGHSLGGGIGLELGRRGRARSVTAVAPVGFWTDREAAYARAVLMASRRVALMVEGPAPTLMRSVAGRVLLLGLLMAQPSRMPAEEAADNLRGLARCPGFEPLLRRAIRERFPARWTPDCPVTIAWPSGDRLLLPRQAERARRVISGARLVWLTGCGHSPFRDDPEQVLRVLLEGCGATPPRVPRAPAPA